MRRHGKLDLILVLPDGSRTLIPAAWTDLDPSTRRDAVTSATLGSVADLLHAGRVLAGIVQADSAARPDDGCISNLDGAHAQPAVGAGPRGDASTRTVLWELLPAEHQLVAIAALARLIAQAVVSEEDDPDAQVKQPSVA